MEDGFVAIEAEVNFVAPYLLLRKAELKLGQGWSGSPKSKGREV